MIGVAFQQPRERSGGARRSRDVVVLGAALYPSCKGHHHERKREALASAFGNAVGRCRPFCGRPGPGDRHGMPPRHLQIQACAGLPRGGSRVLQRVRAGVLPALRERPHNAQGVRRERRPALEVPRLQQAVHPGDRHHIREQEAARGRLNRVSAPSVLVRELQRDDQVEQEVRHHLALLEGQAVRRAGWHPGRRHAVRHRVLQSTKCGVNPLPWAAESAFRHEQTSEHPCRFRPSLPEPLSLKRTAVHQFRIGFRASVRDVATYAAFG